MTTYPSYKDLPKNKANLLAPSRIESMFTGIEHIRQISTGRIFIIYTDQTVESFIIPDLELNNSTALEVCSQIQGNRPKTEFCDSWSEAVKKYKLA